MRASGDEPIFNEDGDVVVVFNGEIYNYRELRADLEAEGHRFSTGTDTEVLVHCYERDGPEFASALESIFAFALYDATRERLVLARDPLGIKPLVLARDGDRYAFGPELPALFEGPVPVGDLDDRALGAYFALGYIPSPLTAFENVRTLRSGERLVVDDRGLDRRCFYRPSVPPRDPGMDAAASEVKARLRSAVDDRLMSDRPLAGEFERAVTGLESDLVDRDTVMEAYEEHATGRASRERLLWAVYVFAQWHRRMRGRGWFETYVTPTAPNVKRLGRAVDR